MTPILAKTPSCRDMIRAHVERGTFDDFAAAIHADPCHWAESIFRSARCPYHDRPFLWHGHDPLHPGQAEILESIFKDRHRFIAVATGHGVGKTFLVKLLPVLWLITHYNGIVILTGASWEALHTDILPGMRATMLSAAWPLHPYPRAETLTWGDEWYVAAISPLHPESAQGKHSQGGVLVLVDEASHLDHLIFNALLSNCTGEQDCMALLGNPLRSDGPFADIILGRTTAGAETCTVTREDGTQVTIDMNRWHRMHISSLESPNLRACTVLVDGLRRVFPSRAAADSFIQSSALSTQHSPLSVEDGAEIYPGLIGPAGLAGLIDRYGVDTPEYQARVLGVVPDQDANVYISRSSLELCGRRPTIPWREDAPLVLGVDVARSPAGDQTVLIARGHQTLHHFEAHRGLDETAVLRRILEVREMFLLRAPSPAHQTLLDELAALEADEKASTAKKHARLDDLMNRLHLAINEDRVSAIAPEDLHVDGTGLGSGLCDRLERLGYPPSVRVIAAGQADDPLGCANRRAECWKNLKEGIKTLAIPERILQFLMGTATLRYKYDIKQRLLIESKEDFKKRNERSPDEADAFALTYYREPGAAAFSAASQSHALRRAPSIRPGVEPAPQVKGRPSYPPRKPVPTFFLHLDGEPIEFDRPGYLCRASWLARREKSAVLWTHVDHDGFWTVFDCLTAEGVTTRIFWERVLDKSLGHRYLYDLFSCPEGAERQGELSLEDELWTISRKGKPRVKSVPQVSSLKSQVSSVPSFTPASHLAGTAGLETLDSRLLATLSYTPSHPYWREHNLNPLDFRSPKRIGIWPVEVLEALTRARLTEHGWKDETLTEDPEALVSAGGPIIRCLRLLAISGAGG